MPETATKSLWEKAREIAAGVSTKLIVGWIAAGITALGLLIWTPLRSILVRPIEAPLYATLISDAVAALLAGAVAFWFHRRAVQAYQQEIAALKQQVETDQISDLPSVTALKRRLEEDVLRAATEKFNLCLILFDIDNFKRVNDTHGMEPGNQVLKAVGRILKGDLRGSTDFAGKYQKGDEFAVIVRATLSNARDHIADRLRSLIASSDIEIKTPQGVRLVRGVTVSAGVTALRDGESLAEFEQRADRALQQAKKSGKNKTVSVV